MGDEWHSGIHGAESRDLAVIGPGEDGAVDDDGILGREGEALLGRAGAAGSTRRVLPRDGIGAANPRRHDAR